MTKYSEMSLAELYRLFETSETAGAEGFRVRCEVLVEYDRRGEPHPRAGRSVYKYYREVAKGQLSPLLVQHYSADAVIIDRLKNQSLEKQDSFVRGDTPIHVAKLDSAGHLKIETKPMARATPFERTLAITESGTLRPANKQKELLLAQQTAARKNRSSSMKIRVDATTDEIVAGQMRLKIVEINAALAEAGGYTLITKKKR